MLYLVDSIYGRYYVEDSERLIIKSYALDELHEELKNGLEIENITYDDLELARRRGLVILRNNSTYKTEVVEPYLIYGNTSDVFNWAEKRVLGKNYFIDYSFKKNLSRLFINDKFYNIDMMMTSMYINNKYTTYKGLIMYFGYMKESDKIVIVTESEYIEFTKKGAIKKDYSGKVLSKICSGVDMKISQLCRKMVL